MVKNTISPAYFVFLWMRKNNFPSTVMCSEPLKHRVNNLQLLPCLDFQFILTLVEFKYDI